MRTRRAPATDRTFRRCLTVGVAPWVLTAGLATARAQDSVAAPTERPAGSAAASGARCAPPSGALGTDEDRGAWYRARALEAYRNADWPLARDCLQHAHALARSARILRALGMVAFNEGDYPSAAASLQAALNEPRERLDGSLRQATEELLTRAKQSVGLLELRLEPAAGALLLDGQSCTKPDCSPLPSDPGRDGETSGALGTQVLFVRPGSHLLRYESPGRQPWESSITVEPGKAYVIAVILVLPPGTTTVAWQDRSSTDRPSAPSEVRRPTNYWIAPAAGAAASLVAAGVFALIGQGRYSDLERQCTNTPCRREDVRDVNDWALATNLALGSAAVLALGSAGVFWYERRADRHPRLVVGATQVAIEGRF